MEKIKYPKTLHLPWSPGLQNDDRLMSLEDVLLNFTGNEIVITEKLDGENTTMYRTAIHARSLDSVDHPSRSWVKALHGQIKYEIPTGWRICGENCFAYHSIFYRHLETYFFVFSIWNENNEALSWDDTEDYCNLFGLRTVPVLFRGEFDIRMIRGFENTLNLDTQEGYVVRNTKSFHYSNFQKNVVKYVRREHIQTDEHWMSKPVVKNLLK